MLQENLRKLNEMKLYGMVEKLEEISSNTKFKKYSHHELIALMVDKEYDRRKNNKVNRLLKNAKIKLPMACVEDIIFSSKRNLKKEPFRDLTSCDFIEHNQNILIAGATGVGKTFVACALANLACRNGHPTLYTRISRFLEYVKSEKILGNYLKVIEKLGKLKLLVLDDLGPDILTKEDRNIFFEIIEERHLSAATIISSQLPLDQWYAVFDDKTTADAVCDRIFHNSYKIQLGGGSMRKN